MSNALEQVQEELLVQAIQEKFIIDNLISIDFTHFELRDQSPPRDKKPKIESKNIAKNQRQNKKHPKKKVTTERANEYL